MEYIDYLKDLYTDSGAYGDPILYVSIALFLVGSVMLFIVRLVKKFIFFCIIALVLPNGIGVVGYLEQGESIKDSVVERGEEMSAQVEAAIEDHELSTVTFGLLGSALALSVGLIGIVRLRMRKETAG